MIEQQFTVSMSDGIRRVDTLIAGTSNHTSPRLSKDTFSKLAAQLDALTTERRRQGENITTIVDEWGFIQLSGKTIPAARRLEIANQIYGTFEGARRVDVLSPTPVIEGVQRAISGVADQTRDQGGDNFRVPYTKLDTEQTRQAQIEGALILDLRSREEFKREHVKDAINMPLGEGAAHLNEIPESQLTILFFSGEVRGDKLNQLIKKIVFERKGYFAVLDSSLNEWAGNGYPTEGSETIVAGDGDYPKIDDLVNAKGQLRE
jgi:rhodanese-related sulfurtransferase